MTMEIQLTRGMVALVDDHWFEYLSKWKWMAIKEPNGYYAARYLRQGEGGTNREKVYMHRVVNATPNDMLTDHKNTNTLDNQEDNLRDCTNQQNQWNQIPQSGFTSKYKGVHMQTGRKTWRARIKVSGKSISLGNFTTPEEAALAYDCAAIEHYGDFARTNFNHEDI